MADDMAVAVDIPEDEVALANFDNSVVDTKPSTQNNSASRKKKYKDQLYATLRSLSIKGLSKAIGNKKPKYRIFWIVVFGMAFTVFLINLTNITSRYLSYPILTQLERDDKPFVWPHFTFCSPANPIPFWTNDTLLKKWKVELNRAEAEYSTVPRYDPIRKKKIWEHYIGVSTINPQEFYINIIKGAIYDLKVIYGDTSVNAYSSWLDLYRRVPNKHLTEIFEVTMHTIRSPIACFTLRPEKLTNVVKDLNKLGHTMLGVKLYLLMDFQSYMDFDIGFENRKLYFYVTKPAETILFQFPHYVLPGTDSTFVLKQKVHKRIAHCIKEKFEFQLYSVNMVDTVKFNGSFEECRTFLSQKLFVDECGCYNPYLPVFWYENKSPILCTNMSLFDNATMKKNIDCLNIVLRDMTNSPKFNKRMNETCTKFLENPCFESSYSASRFTTTWQDSMTKSRRENLIRASQALPNARGNVSIEFARNNLAILKMEWGREKTEATFEQYEYPLSRFMSNFGGSLGLWTGLSAFTVFELLELFYKFIKYKRAK